MAGAVVAKKKMMKKYGWYKHSEDGGTGSFLGLILVCIAYGDVTESQTCNMFLTHTHTLWIKSVWFLTESDSDSEFEAFLDDDNGCCASIMQAEFVFLFLIEVL